MTETMEEPTTFRGRSLDALLPQIREALGPDAVVLRSREGLTGGFAGFFQRTFVEVEATGPGSDTTRPAAASEEGRATDLGDPAELTARNDRATSEGLASPAMALLLEQASPFADELRAAGHANFNVDEPDARPIRDLGLYGPQPNVIAFAPRVVAREEEPEEARTDTAAPDFEPFEPVGRELLAAAPEPPEPPEVALTAVSAPTSPVLRSAAAQAAQQRLTLAGLDSGLAGDLVGEAIVHGFPFASPRSLKRLVRAALAHRIPVRPGSGPGARTLAFVGSAGAGKTTAAGNLGAAYARAGTLPVLVVSLRPADGGAALRERLEPVGITVRVSADGADARRAMDAAHGAMVIVDTPPITVRDRHTVAALCADLKELGPEEVHLAVPATQSSAAATELAQVLEPAGLTHVAVTRSDETDLPGAAIGFCIATGGSLSYLCERDAIMPADPILLAQRLLP